MDYKFYFKWACITAPIGLILAAGFIGYGLQYGVLEIRSIPATVGFVVLIMLAWGMTGTFFTMSNNSWLFKLFPQDAVPYKALKLTGRAFLYGVISMCIWIFILWMYISAAHPFIVHGHCSFLCE